MRSMRGFADENALCLSSHFYQRVVVRIRGKRACGAGNYGGLVIKRCFHAKSTPRICFALPRKGACMSSEGKIIVRFRRKEAECLSGAQTWKSIFTRGRALWVIRRIEYWFVLAVMDSA